jgi:acylphosphatase
MQRVLVQIQGKVQGVGYRAWLRTQATQRGISGWVKNCEDGNVQSEMNGSQVSIDQLLSLCNDGPPRAEVTSVRIISREPIENNQNTTFVIVNT